MDQKGEIVHWLNVNHLLGAAKAGVKKLGDETCAGGVQKEYSIHRQGILWQLSSTPFPRLHSPYTSSNSMQSVCRQDLIDTKYAQALHSFLSFLSQDAQEEVAEAQSRRFKSEADAEALRANLRDLRGNEKKLKVRSDHIIPNTCVSGANGGKGASGGRGWGGSRGRGKCGSGSGVWGRSRGRGGNGRGSRGRGGSGRGGGGLTHADPSTYPH